METSRLPEMSVSGTAAYPRTCWSSTCGTCARCRGLRGSGCSRWARCLAVATSWGMCWRPSATID
eukprot:7063580-Prorocentrum_lima.AAC.1